MVGLHRVTVSAVVCAVVSLTALPVVADPDLPGATSNMELISAGALIIPMDNDKQNIGAPFNLNAYGLVVSLLHDEVPVKWAIAAGKSKDGTDFSANAQQILPSTTAASLLSFRGGPFIITDEWADYARAKASGFGNDVAVYELTADVTVDVRYTLTQKPKVGALDDGGNADIHTDVMDSAGFVPGTHYDVISSAVSVTIDGSTCYSIVTEPHFAEDAPDSDPQASAVRAFVDAGGNFLGQCEGLMTYENNPTYGRFLSTLGIEQDNIGETFEYLEPDLPYSQFVGELDDAGGSIQDWRLVAGSVFQNNGHGQIRNTPSTNTFPATVAKLTSPGTGSVVHYLGGHSYGDGSVEELNGRRMYLNAVLTPADRPGDCDLDFVPDPTQLRAISGTIYDDTNGDANVVAEPAATGVVVRLYADANSNGLVDTGDVFIDETTTDDSGDYGFQVLPPSTGNLYLVTIDSKSFAPGSGFTVGAAQDDVWAQQTYGDNPATAFLDLGARYGGRTVGASDDVDSASTDPADSNYQHVARADVSAADVTGLDFGFSFNVVTNVRGGDNADDDGGADRTVQGSLRQFLDNANAIVGANVMRFVPVTPTNASAGADAWWRVSVTSVLPPVTDTDTTIDGTAYSSADGVSTRNDNASNLGAGGTTGVDGFALPTLDPELEIVSVNTDDVGLDLQAANTTVRQIAIYGFGDQEGKDDKANILVGDFGGTLIERNVIGTTAASFADPITDGKADNIRIVGGDNGQILNNLIGFSGGNGIGCAAGSDGWTIEGNEIRGNSRTKNDLHGVNLTGSASAALRGNLIWENRGAGVDTKSSTGGHTLENNTVRRNGLGEKVTPGIRLFGNGSILDRNVLSENYGAGVMVTDGARLNRVTRNSIYDNGSISGAGGGSPTGQIGIDLLDGGDDDTTGDPPYATANDAGDGDSGANDLLNSPAAPMFAVSSGSGTMVVGTYDGLPDTTFTLEFFSSTAGDPSGFGEGETFIGSDTISTDGGGSASYTFIFPTPSTVGHIASATATGPGNNTSEFGAVASISLAHTVSGTVYHDADASDTFDPGEAGVGDAFVKLISGGVVLAVVQPDFDTGAYSFDVVGDGSYTLIIDDNDLTTDTTATEPVNWNFQNPLTGTLAVVVSGADVTAQDFGLVFDFDLGADCTCGYEDGRLTQTSITIDGDMSDWGVVFSDGDNNSCDATDATDLDHPIQSTGRNLVRTAATWDGSHFSMWTQRTGSSNNTQNFIYYADTNSDEIMSEGEPVVVAKWQGNTGNVIVELYSYNALGDGGHPMVDAGGWADGYSLPGDLVFVKTLPANSGAGATTGTIDGTQMEWKILWSELGLSAGSALSWHVSSTNSNPASAGLSAKIDDNMGGCGGQCSGSNQFGGVQLDSVGLTAGPTTYAAHQLTHSGNGLDTFDLTWSSTGDFSPISVSFYQDLGTVGQYDDGVDLLLTDTDGDPDPDTGILTGGSTFDLIVALELPTSPAGGSTSITTTATSNYLPECGGSVVFAEDSVVDAIAIPHRMVKRAFQADGTPIADGSTLPAGLPVLFMIYIDNPGVALTDVSIADALDPLFGYVAGSIKVDNGLDSSSFCPGGVCNEAAIFSQVNGSPGTCGAVGFECTDAADADVVSYSTGTSTVHAGDGTETGNAQLDLAAGKVWAILIQVTIQ